MGDKRADNIVRTTFPPYEAPETDLYNFVIRDWSKTLDEVALVDTSDGKELTFQQVADAIAQIENDMTRNGVRCGDIVGVWCSNSVQMVLVSLAAWKLGAVVTMISSSLTAEEGKRQIELATCAFLFVNSSNRLKVSKIFSPSQTRVLFTLDGYEFLSLTLPGHNRPAAGQRGIRLGDTCVILFSSGTTGFPKAVELTHINLVHALEMASGRYTERIQSVALVFLPLTHFYGLGSVLKLLNDCTKTLIMPRFDLEEFLRLTSENELMTMSLVPPVAVMMTKRPELFKKYDMSGVMAIFCTGAVLSQETTNELMKLLPETLIAVAQGYGLTEVTGAITRTNEEPDAPPGTVGLVVPSLELKIIDVDSGKTCGPHVRGEIAVRGATVMKGYLGNPKATAEMIDPEGWLHTGDIGYYDKNDFLFIVDRIKEMIKHKGQQVAPAELEDLLLYHPDVLDVGVTGIPDEMMGELPAAFIVLRPNSRTTEKEFQKYVAERVAPYKQLTGGVRFVSTIPKSPTGKILRRLLRDSVTKSQL
jgi:4-coumarate--CoA ligase